MSDTTTPAPDNSRNKAYTAATTRLRDAHRDEFNAFLEEEYGKMGLAPRKRRTPEEIEAEKAAQAQVKAEKAERKRQEKIAALQAQIEALAAADAAPAPIEVDDDPMSVFKEPAA